MVISCLQTAEKMLKIGIVRGSAELSSLKKIQDILRKFGVAPRVGPQKVSEGHHRNMPMKKRKRT